MATASKLIHCLLVLLLSVLFGCLSARPEDTQHSLCFNFTVKTRSKLEGPWYEGQCSVDGMPFLKFDNVNKNTPLGDLGKKVNATNAWEVLTQSLKDFGEELKNQLLSMEPEAFKNRGHHTLQGTMASHYIQERLTNVSWTFTIDGQYSFHLDPINETWGVIHPEARGFVKQWETNTELVRDLRKRSRGDFSHCLKELLTYWKEMPRSTIKALNTTQLTCAAQIPPTMGTTQLPSAAQIPPTMGTTQLPSAAPSQYAGVLIIITLIIFQLLMVQEIMKFI